MGNLLIALVISVSLISLPAAAEPAAATAVDPATETTPADEADDRLEPAGWALLVAGAAALAAALTLGARAAADHEAWQRSRDPWDKPLLKERGETRALAADLVGGVGLAAAVAGCVVILTF